VSTILTTTQREVAGPVIMLQRIPVWQRTNMQIEISGYPVTDVGHE
jgi:hypothetical protein